MRDVPQSYEDTLLEALRDPEPLVLARDVLLKLAHDGYEPDTVVRWLDRLRTSFRNRDLEDQTDLVADVMDIASGSCTPRLRVWPSEAS